MPESTVDSANRGRVLVAAGAVIAVLVAGLLSSSLGWKGGDGERSVLDQQPFAAAMTALASSPQVYYHSTTPGVGGMDVRATHNGELIATLTQDGQSSQLLRVGGRVYLRPPSGLLSVTNPARAGKWLTGSDVTGLLGPVLDRFVPPQQLASLLAGSLRTAHRLETSSIDGQPVLTANTKIGVLSVTKNAPWRIVRLIRPRALTAASHPVSFLVRRLPPPTPTSVGVRHDLIEPSYLAAARSDGSGVTEFPPAAPAEISRTDQQLKTDTEQLANAIDTDVDFTVQGEGHISCGDPGCQVDVTVTNSVNTSRSGATITGGNVTAELTASINIEGEPAGGCIGAGQATLNGTATISCTDPDAGGVFASVAAEKKAQAEQRSATEGGAEVDYRIACSGEYYVYARAQVNVEELIDQEDREAADDSVALYKAPGVGMTQKLLEGGFQPEDFPGDPRSTGYPDGRAYFGLNDLGKDIALDYASRGNWESDVIEIRIPAEEFQRYFQDDVRDYDGIPRAQVAIPNTSFGILNRYPRKLAR